MLAEIRAPIGGNRKISRLNNALFGQVVALRLSFRPLYCRNRRERARQDPDPEFFRVTRKISDPRNRLDATKARRRHEPLDGASFA
jgi:hypothetical protein